MAESHDVTVLGCGLMGTALAQALAERGRSVAVWNRSPDKAEVLAGEYITPVREISDAVGASPLVISCLTTYDTTRAALDSVTDWTGKTLANVASGAPAEVEPFAAWAAERGADYLDGSILGYPKDIGTEAAAILYSGSGSGWAEHQSTLILLTPLSMLVSDQVNAASVLNAGLVGAFVVPALSAFVEAVTYMLSQGIDPALLEALIPATQETLKSELTTALREIASGDFVTDQATIATYAEALDGGLEILQASGQRARVFAAAMENLSTAVDAGLGDLAFAAQSLVMGGAGVDPT